MNDTKRHRGTVQLGMSLLGVRVFAPLGAIAVLAILLVGAGGAGATNTPPPEAHTILATIPLVATVVANSTMVFAQGVTNCSDIWGITPSGNVSVYATVPISMPICEEGALALAPYTIPEPAAPGNSSLGWQHGGWGQGGCGCNTETLYDAIDGVLYEITDGGSNVSTVATFPGVPAKSSENMGLTYDQVGFFDNDLIVTSSSGGMVWLVNATGNVTLLAQLHAYIGGPAVAPLGFGTYGGEVLIAVKYLDQIDAINASGNVSLATNWTTPNAVSFQSTAGFGGGWHRGGYGGGCGNGGGCSFGPNHDVLFVANYSSGAVEGFPASDIQNFTGQGFIAGGLNAGIASFTGNGTTTLFASQTARLSDLAFINCFQPNQCCHHHGCGGGGHGCGGK